MALHRRAFHLHLHQTSGSDEVRWHVTRSLWTARNPTRSAHLGFGVIKLAAEGGTPQEIARALLQAALADYAVQLQEGSAVMREV